MRLKVSEVKAYREKLYAEQGGVCALTHYPITLDQAVLDHCHTTGQVRGVLHRGANALLGKVENNHKRYGVSLPMAAAMGRNLGDYLTADYSANPAHPSHRTEDEKRIRRNKLAVAARKAKKEL